MPETEAERAARKAREAELRAKETPAEREARKAKEAERERRRAEETPEERAERKAREAAREKETPEQRAERKAREAERARAEETPEQRAERKAREAERARAEETPEQRAERKAREAQRRAEETPEQRAERKAREARAEETPQQRLERKAKEAERERAARDAADQPAKPLIHRSTTQQPPTAQSTTAASPARADMGSGNDGSSGGAMKPIQFQAPKKAEEEPDDYEDDFEEVFDAGALNEALKATEAENAKLRQQQQGGSSQGSGAKASAAADIVYEGKARAGFDADSLARQKHKVQFEKDLARAVALRRLVDLDEARFTIFDMSPQSQYEVFLRQMQSSAASAATADGKDNAAAATVVGGLANSHAQGPEARVDIAIQAERVGRKVKGAQAPDDLGLFPEGAATKASAEASTAKNADEQTADGGDNAAAAAPKGPRVTALDKRRVDMNALGAFLANVFPCVRALLDENDAAADPTGKRRQADSGAAAAAKHAFTAGSTVLASPYADGRKVVRTEYSQLSPNYLLAAHGPLEGSPKTAEATRAAMHEGLALLWNVNDPTRPEKVLVAPAPIVDACLSPTKAYLVYAALSDGSMCVWDLRESEGVHGGNALNLGMRAPSYATGWNSADLHSASVRRLRVSGYNSAMGSAQRSADETEQLVSMDGTGSLNFWMVSAPDDRTAAATAAGSSLQMSSIIDDASKLGSTSGGGGGLKRNGSFSFGALSPSRRRGAGGSSGDGDCGLAVSSSVHLYRSSTVNCLTDVRAKSAAKRDTDLLGGGVGDDGFRIESTVYDMDISPTDPSHVLVGATAAVLHVSKFGAITAPSQYAPPGGMPPAVTAVSCCQGDSRLLLAGYDNGSCRLFLREESAPRLTVQLSPSAIVQVSWTFNKRWVAFALDEMGQLFVLDFASSNKSKPVAMATATDGSKLTTVSVGYDERETKLALGHASGRVEVHVFSDSVLPVPNLRDERWL